MCEKCRNYDTPPEPDSKMLELVALVKTESGMDQEDDRLDRFCDDRGDGRDTFNLCCDLGLIRATHNSLLDCGSVWPV